MILIYLCCLFIGHWNYLTNITPTSNRNVMLCVIYMLTWLYVLTRSDSMYIEMQRFTDVNFPWIVFYVVLHVFSSKSKLCAFFRSIYRYCTSTSLVVINDFILKHYVVFLRFLIIQRNISEFVWMEEMMCYAFSEHAWQGVCYVFLLRNGVNWGQEGTPAGFLQGKEERVRGGGGGEEVDGGGEITKKRGKKRRIGGKKGIRLEKYS